MSDEVETQSNEAGPPAAPIFIRPWEYILLMLYLVILALGMIVAIIAFWPVIPPEGVDQSASQVTQFLWWRVDLQLELRLLVTVVMAGALGGLIHCLRSLIRYVGTRELARSWYLYYLGVPLVGGILSLLFYFVLRGGLFSPQVSVSETNPFGFVAVAGLVGMFSDKAAEKLKELADSLFAEQKKSTTT